MTEPEDIPEECEGCGWDGKLEGCSKRDGGKIYLCEVCYGTSLGISAEYPHHVIDSREVLQAISYATNLILAELRKEKS